MELLINLLIYVLVFVVLWLIMEKILVLLGASPQIVNITKAIFLIIVLIVIVSVFWGTDAYLTMPRYRIK